MKIISLFFLCFTCVLADLDTEWWKYTTIYELLVQTFKDSDGDGIGDLQGVISKLDHFDDLGIETIYMTPIYTTGMLDMGYDIIDYNEIDPRYGTMEDFDELIKEMKARGMKLIMDCVINHSSYKHEWFQKSIQRIDPYTDYYVWINPTFDTNSIFRKPPNDWGSYFDDVAWTWDETRKQFYYHAFLKEQPDLNLRNENLKKELLEMLKFWLDKGVAGFRLDATSNYMEDKLLRNFGLGYVDQKESFQFIHEIRTFFDEYNNKNGGIERILAPEPHATPESAVDYYGSEEYRLSNFIFNYYFDYIGGEVMSYEMDYIIQSWLSYLPPGARVCWVHQDHDRGRVGTRIKETYMDIFAIITAIIPGVLHVYYGQEIGLKDGIIMPSQVKDLSGLGSRDPNRMAMQWDDSKNAGFSNSDSPFSPPCYDYPERNANIQKNSEISHYNLLKSLLTLRKTETLKYGEYDSYVYSKSIYIFWRYYQKQPTIIAVFNLGHDSNEINFKKVPRFEQESRTLIVVTASINSDYREGDSVSYRDKYEFIMRPNSAIVFTTFYGKHYSKKVINKTT